jgi:ATP-dependent Lhr-like helicase
MGGGFTAEEFFDEIRTTHAYQDLSRYEWQWTIEFITHGGEALRAYPEFARVKLEDGRYVISSNQIARRHLLSTGTIVSDSAVDVRYLTGGRLGSIEEGFIAKLRAGDLFTFSGKVLEFVRVRDMTAWVRKSKASGGAVPSWQGSRMPLSSELCESVRTRLDQALRGIYEGPEMEAIRPVLETQAKISIIPARNEFLIERVETRDGHHLFFYPFEGRLVHEGLAALLAYRIAEREPITFSMAINDYGFELLAPTQADLEGALAAGILTPDNLAEDIPASLNATELARRQFREIARVAGLTFTGFPGQSKTARQMQASSGLIFDVFVKYDATNLLIDQAHREVLEQQLEGSRLGRTLARLSRSRLVLRDVSRFSPLSFPLVIDRSRNRLSSEKLSDRIKRMSAR